MCTGNYKIYNIRKGLRTRAKGKCVCVCVCVYRVVVIKKREIVFDAVTAKGLCMSMSISGAICLPAPFMDYLNKPLSLAARCQKKKKNIYN